MKILVSFCNQYGDAHQSNLSIIDTKTGEKNPITVEVPNMGIHGLAIDWNFIYAVYRADKPGIVIIDRLTKETLLTRHLKELKDPHGICVIDDVISIVSTGTDQVLQYRYDSKKNSVEFIDCLWSPKGSSMKSDTHHINSIYVYEDDIYVSGFGPREKVTEQVLWRTAKDGYVFNITAGKKVLSNIYHPHSVVIAEEGIYCCDSLRGSVKCDGDEILKLSSGYTRGLVVAGKYLVVGSSDRRKKSKSTGIKGKKYIGEGVEAWELESCCNVQVFRKNIFGKYRREAGYDYTDERNEIYDIVLIEK